MAQVNRNIDYIAGSFTGKNVKVLESQATALNHKKERNTSKSKT